MDETEHPLENLPAKNFDEIYDATAAKMRGEPTEKIHAHVGAAMHIRQHEMNRTRLQQELCLQVAHVEATNALYEGYRAFERAQGNATNETFDEFQSKIEYLKAQKPGTLLLYLPIWQAAEERGGDYAVRLFEKEEAALSAGIEAELDARLAGETGEAMRKYMDVMWGDDGREKT